MGMIFALGAGLCCGLLGLWAGAALERKRRRLMEWQRALRRLEIALESLCGIPEALKRSGEPVLCAMAEVLRAHPLTPLGEAWLRCAGDEGALLLELFEELDRGDLARRRLVAAQARERLEEAVQRAAERAEKNRPLYRSLGAFGGLALIMILL